jgi:outer membrane protein assembly factor BamA
MVAVRRRAPATRISKTGVAGSLPLPVPSATGLGLAGAAGFLLAHLVLAPSARSEVALSVEGNDLVPRRKIEAGLDLPPRPREMDESDWEVWSEDAAGLLSDLYREIGCFDAAFRFEHGDSALGPDDRYPIRVFVREGARYKFGKVEILPLDGTAPAAHPEDLKSRPGRDFDQDLVFRDRRLLLNRYGDAGFLHARVAERLDPDTVAKAVRLAFTVEPGKPVVFDTLIIRNLREGDSTGAAGVTRRSLMRSLADLRRGDTVSQGGIASLERKLRSTRVFNYVRLKDSLLATGRSALILSTEERVPGEMDASVFFETQYGFGVGMNWTHGNLFGLLHEGRLGGSLAQNRQNVYLGYASPLFFGTGFRFDNELVSNWYQDSRLQRGAGLYEGDFDIINTTRLSRALTSWSRLVGSTELRGLDYKSSPTAATRDFTLNYINSLFFSFLDNAPNPSRGVRWGFTWGNGGQVFKRGELQAPTAGRHNWLEGESAAYLPLHDRLKLAARLDGGRFFDAGGSNSDRFFLGGPRSVRSFGWRELCPVKNDSTGICSQEDVEPAYFLASFEVRTSPFSAAFINPEGKLRHLLGLQVVPFVDFGNVWEVGKALAPEGEGKAYGLGLRYSLLSIFNLRVDFATDGP